MTGPLNTNSSTTPVKVEYALRAHRAVLMRRDGASYEEIAEKLGYSDRASAYRAVFRYISKLPLTEDVRILRWLEAERLDELQRAYSVRAKTDVSVARLMLEIFARRCRLLGLDRNDDRMAGAMEASAVAELAATAMLSAHLIGAMIEAGVEPDQQDRIIEALNERFKEAQEHDPDEDGDEEQVMIEGEGEVQ